ncbi:MAG TPA: regulatory protein RecX, partial [Desulfosarcina sp.]|nr:regulatory protein RecX [Desulfosarcina sp.]
AMVLNGRRSRAAGSDSARSLESALRMLTRRDHTCHELAVKLRGKGFGSADIDQALARCRQLGYLDDARTAAVMVDHLVARGYGPLRVRQTLLQKGLDAALVQKVLIRCGDEAHQVLGARRLLAKKSARLAREADACKRRLAAYRYLAGRGFPAEVIRKAIDDL